MGRRVSVSPADAAPDSSATFCGVAVAGDFLSGRRLALAAKGSAERRSEDLMSASLGLSPLGEG